MDKQRQWAIQAISKLVKGTPSERVQTAIMIIDLLNQEGLLHLGYGDADIDIVTNKFVEQFGITKTTSQDRFAARRITTKYGAQAVCGIIELLNQRKGEPFAPVIGSISQLETKWVSVMAFLRKGNTETIDA